MTSGEGAAGHWPVAIAALAECGAAWEAPAGAPEPALELAPAGATPDWPTASPLPLFVGVAVVAGGPELC